MVTLLGGRSSRGLQRGWANTENPPFAAPDGMYGQAQGTVCRWSICANQVPLAEDGFMPRPEREPPAHTAPCLQLVLENLGQSANGVSLLRGPPGAVPRQHGATQEI